MPTVQVGSSDEASGWRCFESMLPLPPESSIEALAEQLAFQQSQALLDEIVLNRAIGRQVIDDMRQEIGQPIRGIGVTNAQQLRDVASRPHRPEPRV